MLDDGGAFETEAGLERRAVVDRRFAASAIFVDAACDGRSAANANERAQAGEIRLPGGPDDLQPCLENAERTGAVGIAVDSLIVIMKEGFDLGNGERPVREYHVQLERLPLVAHVDRSHDPPFHDVDFLGRKPNSRAATAMLNKRAG